MTPEREPDQPVPRPAAGLVLATQLLATAGWVAFALPFGYQALGPFVTFTSHSEPDPMARMATAIDIALSPAPLGWTVVLLGAALALYQAWPFGRLVAGAAAWLPLTYVGVDAFGLRIEGAEIVAVVFGVIVTLCLLTTWGAPRGEPGSAGAGTAPGSRPGRAGRSWRLWVLVAACWAIAAIGLGPLLWWLLGVAGIAPTAREQTWADGLLLVAGTILLPGAAVATAIGLRARSRPARDFGPAAVGPAGLWAAGWLAVLASAVAGGEEPSSLAAAASLGLLAVGFLAIGTYPLAVLALLTSRASFAEVAPRPARPRGIAGIRSMGRGVLVAAAATAVGVLVVGIGTFARLTAVEPLGYGAVRFEGGVYQHATPVRVSVDRLVTVGTLDDWWPGVSVGDPTVFALVGVDAQVAIAVRGSTIDSMPEFDLNLFVRGDGTIPAAWCPHVPVDHPEQPPGPCGPAETILLDGRRYWADPNIVLPPGDLVGDDLIATTDAALVVEFDTTVRAIRDVDLATAVGLRIGERTLAYVAEGARLAYGQPLCRYPTRWGALLACLGHDERLMFLDVAGVEYALELDLFEIPRDALRQAGTYQFLGGFLPEPGTPYYDEIADVAEGPVYRIAGAPPERVVALILDGRVRVARRNDGGDAVPAALCPYLRDDGRTYLEGEEKSGGLARYGC